MFTHIVFFNLKDNCKENIDKAVKILKDMEGNIPELKEIEVGSDVVKSERSFDIALITRFDNRKDYETYDTSEYHVNNVIKNLKPMLKESKSVDFES